MDKIFDPVKLQEMFKMLMFQDYLIIGISVFLGILFIFIGTEKIYKSYLGIILGLFLFSFCSLTLSSLNDNDIGINGFRDFFINHKIGISSLCLFFIPLLAFIMPMNNIFSFRIGKNKALNDLQSLLLGFLYIPFIFCIFLSIINNKFLFSINIDILNYIKTMGITTAFTTFFTSSVIFNFLQKFDYIFNLFLVILIFYKMTIGGIIDFLVVKFALFIKAGIEERMKKDEPKKEAQEKKEEHHH